jgi:hypothetical protein
MSKSIEELDVEFIAKKLFKLKDRGVKISFNGKEESGDITLLLNVNDSIDDIKNKILRAEQKLEAEHRVISIFRN